MAALEIGMAVRVVVAITADVGQHVTAATDHDSGPEAAAIDQDCG